MKKNIMNTELRKDAKFKFSNSDKPACEINFRSKKISDECLKKVFKLDKVLYSASKCA